MSTSETTEPVFSIWASMATWYTPTPLFLLLNMMIITVALAAYFTTSKSDQQNSPNHRFFRRPSLGDSVKSVDFSFNRADSDQVEIFEDTQRDDKLDQTQSLDSDFYQTHQLVRAPSLLERAKSWKFSFYDEKPESSDRFQNTDSYDNLEHTQSGNSDDAPRRTSQSLLERVKSLKLSIRLFEEQTQRDSDRYNDNSPPSTAIRNKVGSGEMPVKTKKSAIGNKMSSGAIPEFGTTLGSGKLPTIGNKPNSGEILAIENHSGSGEVPAIENKMGSGSGSGGMLQKMTKSLSEKLKVGVKEVDNVEQRRPETMRATGKDSEDDSVNDKADDFISKFRQQLKLQRMDSMLRYREMIDRGSSQ